MRKTRRIAVIGVILAFVVIAMMGCEACEKLLKATGSIKGRVVSPAGTGLSDVSIMVYKNTTAAQKVKPDTKNPEESMIDLEGLIKEDPDYEGTTDSSGNFEIADVKTVDSPFVVVAKNSITKDVRGIDAETRKFNVDKAIVVEPDKATEIDPDFVLPDPNTPPPTSPTPAEEQTDPSAPVEDPTTAPPSVAPEPSAPNTGLPPADPATGWTAFHAYDGEGMSGTMIADASSADENVTYTLTGNVVTIHAVHSSPPSNDLVTLKISNVPTTGDPTVTQAPVKYSALTANGYPLVVPGSGKTALQLLNVDDASHIITIESAKLPAEKQRPTTIILTWDKGNGTDVDLHTYDDIKGEESWFGNLAITNGSLDLDNIEGYGPETFTGNLTKGSVRVHYWWGTGPTKATVRVIGPLINGKTDNTFGPHTLSRWGDWWDVVSW
ncbi:MAG: hypothetical protein ACUVXI_08600 [bacterium]